MKTTHSHTINKGILSLLGAICILAPQALAQKATTKPVISTADATVQQSGMDMMEKAYQRELFPKHLKKLITTQTVQGTRTFSYPSAYKRSAPTGASALDYFILYEDEQRYIMLQDYNVTVNGNKSVLPRFHVFPKTIIESNLLAPRPKMKVPSNYFPVDKKEAQAISKEGQQKIIAALSYGLNLRVNECFIWYQPPFKEEQGVGSVADLATCYYQDPKQWAAYQDESQRANMPISKQVDAILGVCCPSMLDIPKYFEKAYFQIFLPQRMHLMVEDAPNPAKHELAVLYLYHPHRLMGEDGLAPPKYVMRLFLRDQRENIYRNLLCLQANLSIYHKYLLAQENSSTSASCKLVGDWLSALKKYTIMFVRDGEVDQDIMKNYEKYKKRDGDKLIDFGKVMRIRYEP